MSSDDGSALELLRDREPTLRRLEDVLYAGAPLTPMPFPQLIADAAAVGVARQGAAFLNGVATEGVAAPTLAGVLGLLRAGEGDRLRALFDASAEAEQVRSVLTDVLGAAVAHALVDKGQAYFRLDWGGPWQLVDTDGNQLDPWQRAADALATPDGAASLEQWLASYGVPLDVPASEPAREPVELPDAVLGAMAPVTGQGVRYLVVLRSGIALLKPDRGARLAAAKGSLTGGFVGAGVGGRMLEHVLKKEPAELVAAPGATYLPWDSIASVTVTQRSFGRGVCRVAVTDGRELTVKLSSSTELAGEPWAVMAQVLGDRYRA